MSTGRVRRLTDESSGVPFISDRDPSWSPDRSRIVPMRADASTMRLVVSTPDGTPARELAVEATYPIWLDGSAIVCAVPRLGGSAVFDRADLVAVDASSGAQTPIVVSAPGEWLSEPAWHRTSGLAFVC